MIVQTSVNFVSYEKPSSLYCAMLFSWWGCRRNLTLITLGSDRVKSWFAFTAYRSLSLFSVGRRKKVGSDFNSRSPAGDPWATLGSQLTEVGRQERERNWVTFQLKPTRAKFTTSMELGIVWPPTWLELDRVGLNLIKLKFSPNSSHVFHRLATSANSSQFSPSCFVIVMWLRGRIQTVERFLANWPDLTVPFGHPPMQFWFCNLARVGLSWEYRLCRALV